MGDIAVGTHPLTSLIWGARPLSKAGRNVVWRFGFGLCAWVADACLHPLGFDTCKAEMNDTMQLQHIKEHLVGMDVRDADAMQVKTAETKKERVAFEEKFRALRKKVDSSRASVSSAASSSGSRRRPQAQAKRVPRKLPRKDDESLASWSKLLPDGARIVQDDFNSRFLCWYRRSSLSRSWTLHGARAALEQLVRWAWVEAGRFGQECLVDGLLQAD